jgi:hypothetical protein
VDTRDNADDIRRRMAQIRSEFRQNVREVAQAAQEYTDWRTYVRANPWAFLAAAAALGYFAVPQRFRGGTLDAQQLKTALAYAVPVKARRGLLGMALGLLGPILLRQSLALASSKLQEFLAARPAGFDEDEEQPEGDGRVQSRTHPR